MNWMNLKSLTIAGAMVVGLGASALAQDKIELIFPDVNPPDVPRSVDAGVCASAAEANSLHRLPPRAAHDRRKSHWLTTSFGAAL